MKLLTTITLILATVGSVAAHDQKNEKIEPIADVQRDIEYEKIGSLSLKLDVFRPKEHPAGPTPAIVWFHGGGWNSGVKAMNPWREGMFVQRGYCFISVDYRLSTVAPFPAAVEDCKSAIRWVRKNAGQYNIDPNRIGAWGYSAGGHLALMAGLTDEKAGLEGTGNDGVSSRVQAVCSWAGPTDLKDFPKVGLAATATKQLCGGTPDEKPDVYQKASPLTYASKDCPPILLLHGEADELVPIRQAEALATKLAGLGADVKLIRVKNLGHGAPVGKQDPPVETLKQTVLDFFDRALKAPAGK